MGFQELRDQDLKNWEDLLHSLFGSAIPNHSEWTNLPDIIKVLDTVGKHKAMNHLFAPNGGGNDLASAIPSVESGMLELKYAGGSSDIVNPNKLSFHSFDTNLEWAYFRLECNALPWADVDGMTLEDKANIGFDLAFEEVTEVTKGDYQTRSLWDHGYFGVDEDGDSKPLPQGARPLSRLIRKGSFVLFAKMSLYGQRGSYNGEHDRMSNQQFENAIRNVAQRANQ